MLKAINIKWDTSDEEWNDTLTSSMINAIADNLPTEVNIPEELIKGYDGTNLDTYYPDISDWLSDKYGFCHYGFEIEGKDEEKFFDCSITITDAGEEETKDIHFLIEANSFTDAVAKVMKDLDI